MFTLPYFPHNAHDLMIMNVMHGCIFHSTLLTVQTSNHVAFVWCVALVAAFSTHVWHCQVTISTSLIGGDRIAACSREVLTSLTSSLVWGPIIFVGRGVCRVLKHKHIKRSNGTNSATPIAGLMIASLLIAGLWWIVAWSRQFLHLSNVTFIYFFGSIIGFGRAIDWGFARARKVWKHQFQPEADRQQRSYIYYRLQSTT